MHKPLSLRKNFAWSPCGNIVYGACQWANLVVLAKFTSAKVVGSFALASAICMPVIQLTDMQIRTLQIIDVEDKYEFGHYMALRLIMCAIAIITIAMIGLSTENTRETLWLILVLGLGYCITSIRFIFHAVMQKSQRMDLIARAQIILGVLTLSSLGLLVWLTSRLFIGVLGMLAYNIY
jgi:O-antigen/teichoic acid export membrane protein